MIRMLTALLFFLLAIVSPAAAEEQPSSTLDLGFELSHITYKEPEIREAGVMLGVHGVYSYYGALRVPAGLRLDGRLSGGSVTYTGQNTTGTPIEMSGILDSMFEVRGLVGIYNLGEPGARLIPWVGLGYRYLYDGADKIAGGYRRESNYYYVPILLERIPARRPGWSVGWTAEYDYFLGGKQHSYLSDSNAGYNDLTNTQKDGFGYRGSVRFIWREQQSTVTVEPFIRYWRIAQSESAAITYYGNPYATGFEPTNTSTEIGLQVAVTF